MTPIQPAPGRKHFPTEDAMRAPLHNAVLARTQARMGLPVQMAYVVVLNADIDREQECQHLAKLPGQKDLTSATLPHNYLRVQVGACTLKWERHSEFTSYTIVRALPPSALLNDAPQQLVSQLLLDDGWLEDIPGKTLAAIHLVMMLGDPPQAMARAAAYDHWFADGLAVASQMGSPTHSCVVTDCALQSDGFERLLVLASPGMGEARVGRVAQRLLEIETYRLMALRGLPVAKDLRHLLTDSERDLATVTDQLEHTSAGHQVLLASLLPVAARVERAIAEHRDLFEASKAYHAMVIQRLAELREKAIPGTQTLGEFMQRRLSPAMATVDSTAQRLEALSQRIARTAALLRTRANITTVEQNQQLLETLAGTQLVLQRLQGTVKVLAIAAVTYYLVRLLWQGGRALQGAGLLLNPELLSGAVIPLVLGGVWFALHRLNKKLRSD